MMKTGDAVFIPTRPGENLQGIRNAIQNLKKLGYSHVSVAVQGGIQIWCMFAPDVEI